MLESFDLKDFFTAISKVNMKKDDPLLLKQAIDGFKFDNNYLI